MEDHVYRASGMGAWVLINARWYYLATYQDLSEVGWRVWIMANTSSMTRMAIVYAAGIVLVVAMGFVAVISLIERRRGLLRALDVQRQAHQTLANSANELERQEIGRAHV